MRVGIIGYGFVGKALANGIKNKVDIFKVDPKLGTSISDLINFNPEIIFICVPTPMNDDGSQDIKILKKVIDELLIDSFSSKIVVKSTILPSNLQEFEDIKSSLVFNPEFLREKTANEDFINSEFIVLGGSKENTKVVAEFYKDCTKCKTNNYQFTDAVTACFLKYSINTFLASKVIFFNQLYELFQATNSSVPWEEFIKMISFEERIGKSHMQVPGHDGKFGYGGACFPKDVNAFIKYSKEVGRELSLLNKANNINNIIRAKYNDVNNREKEQNINFNNGEE